MSTSEDPAFSCMYNLRACSGLITCYTRTPCFFFFMYDHDRFPRIQKFPCGLPHHITWNCPWPSSHQKVNFLGLNFPKCMWFSRVCKELEVPCTWHVRTYMTFKYCSAPAGRSAPALASARPQGGFDRVRACRRELSVPVYILEYMQGGI